jgi:hypothetical protein
MSDLDITVHSSPQKGGIEPDPPSMSDLDITVHSSPQKGGIEPDPAYIDLAAVLSAQPMLQLFPWEA